MGSSDSRKTTDRPTGRTRIEDYQKRAPLNVDIQNNTIQLVFKKEVQVLKFIGL